jgi:RNA-binding protein YhbY
MFVADCLKKFIKYNSKLLHLNIEGTGLTEYCLKEIAEALRKSRSLISIHLSDNLGLNESTIDHIFQRVHCKVSDFNKLNHIEMVAFEKKMKNQDSAINHKMF